MPEAPVALSVKQPWAALLVGGVKTVEVRTWAARRRGLVLIHASRVADDRPEGWALVATPELERLAGLRGGVIGVAELTGCRVYDSAAGFEAEQELHRNAPGWFAPPRLYGLVFRAARPVPFHPCGGRTMFFEVPDFVPTDEGAGGPPSLPRGKMSS